MNYKFWLLYLSQPKSYIMRTISTIIILLASICSSFAQKNHEILMSKSEFETARKLYIISTEQIIKDTVNQTALLKFKVLDYADNKIKYYEAGLDQYGFVSQSRHQWLLGSLKSVSFLTVPFKIRKRNDDGRVTAQADLKNIGVYLPFYVYEKTRYWLNNTTSKHKFALGLLISPMAETLNDKNTGGYFNNTDKSYTAVMLSTSFAATYTYKSLTFALVPIGFDWGLDDAGKKWDNNGKYWAGFGIGIDTKFFGF